MWILIYKIIKTEIHKIINVNWVSLRIHEKIKIKYKTLNRLLNALDVDWKKIDALIMNWYTLDEAILVLLWDDHKK